MLLNRSRTLALSATAIALALGVTAHAGMTASVAPVAGNGAPGAEGDGGPAAAAQLHGPLGIAVAHDGGLLVADTKNHRIRRISAAGVISTVAGTGVAGFDGDDGPATAAMLDAPAAVSALPGGGFVIADSKNHRIRKVDASGTITTVAGTGVAGAGGDGGPATAAQLQEPGDVLVDGDALLIADTRNHRVRRVAADGTISTLAGQGGLGFAGDRGPAAAAQLAFPTDLARLAEGSLLVADRGNYRVRRIDPQGVIDTVAGGGKKDVADGIRATGAALGEPAAVAAALDGGFLVAEASLDRVRLVDAKGQISTVADGTAGLDGPEDVSVTAAGALLVADAGNHRVVRVDVADGTSTQDPGKGTAKPDGDTRRVAKPLPPAEPPRLGHSVTTAPASGRVRVRLPDTTIYRPLDQAASLPVGTIVDASRGRIAISAAQDHDARKLAVATFSGGSFRVLQRAEDGGVTELRLSGGSSNGCRAERGGKAVAAASRVHRRLWGRGKGRFRTRGRDGAATVRGTVWLTEDRCNGTHVRVRRGAVEVEDFARGRTVVVRAGERYLARRAKQGRR